MHVSVVTIFVFAFEVVRCSFIEWHAGVVIQIQNEMHSTNVPSSCTCFVIIIFFLIFFFRLSHLFRRHTTTTTFLELFVTLRSPQSMFYFYLFVFVFTFIIIISRNYYSFGWRRSFLPYIGHTIRSVSVPPHIFIHISHIRIAVMQFVRGFVDVGHTHTRASAAK